jgi:di/tricarboxylate transporter
MTFEQAAILLLLLGMLAIFALDRFRMEVVTLAGLGAGFTLGLVPVSGLFAGISDPAVVTVAEILLIVQVLSRASVLDRLAGRIGAAGLNERGTVAVLCVTAAAISIFMNNIGALALMIPVVYSVCNAIAVEPRRVLMPVSFATLLGGICSVIGTPANLIASDLLRNAAGHGFAMFDFAWAGIPTAIAGLTTIVFFVPRRAATENAKRPETGREARRIVAPLLVPRDSALSGVPFAALPFRLYSVLRQNKQVFLAARDATLRTGDLVLADLDEDRLERLLADGDLAGAGGGKIGFPAARAVVMPGSTVVGSRVGNLHALASRNVRVVAVSPRTMRIEGAFEDLQLSLGDVLYLDGAADRIEEALAETEMLAVSGYGERRTAKGGPFGLAVFIAGILLAATSTVSPPVAFGAVVLVLAATGTLDLRTGLAGLNWPILIMLAGMIPLGTAVETTGAAKVLAGALASAMPAGSPLWLGAAMLLLAVLVTPFVNNASTVIVLGPIAVQLAAAAGIAPQPLLIAVAMGASIDFLTPFGHHNNTLVMGLGNYRFSEYPRAGWPITIAAALTGLFFIHLVW